MKNKIDEVKKYFLETVEAGNPIYSYLPRHVVEVEKWVKKILREHSEANKEIIMFSVWLHDIGQAIGSKDDDHAVKSEIEARRFLTSMGLFSDKVEKVAHCVRTHRCRDVRPQSLEAKILAAADSVSHMTDIVYIDMCSRGLKNLAIEKLERDYRDAGLFPELKDEITPLYEAWKKLLDVYPG